MKALSFIGTGISSSELSALVPANWEPEAACEAAAFGTGFDWARSSPGLDGALLNPDLSDGFRVGAEKWLDPMGVGEAVAIGDIFVCLYCSVE